MLSYELIDCNKVNMKTQHYAKRKVQVINLKFEFVRVQIMAKKAKIIW